MNGVKNRYVMLMASLPPHSADFFATRYPPISAIQLQQRLAWLSPEDAADLNRIQGILYWSEVIDGSDAEFLQHVQGVLQQIDNCYLKAIILWRLQLRTLVAAMRLKHHQPQQEVSMQMLAMTPFARDILRNWQLPDFGLRYRFPWINDIDALIQQESYLALEKYLLKLIWRYYEQQSQGHFFDFEAVVVYVLRWDLVNRWNQQHGQKARQRFVEIMQRQVEEAV
ncbi:DUF2764 family protein [methane-oxidizing endosymbiont of Gigantopelta aegis]|uniref:DUF2764 family protein n=1 Tax=methane-oxidizing endosymbiont of Gigantopelta aegis TaxID=2794938 RepID=UPI0018DB3C5E|nr:DUF2764 family protein [methane-oxidizing endosymbiont of Gigantopelta aegis]